MTQVNGKRDYKHAYKLQKASGETKDQLERQKARRKYDKEGKPRKVKGCSSIAILNYGEETEALSFVHKYIKDNKLDE